MSGSIPLVRIRNPWGNEAEWNGAWSDQSREWEFIPPEEREEIGLTFDHDGEFWMSFKVSQWPIIWVNVVLVRNMVCCDWYLGNEALMIQDECRVLCL